MSWDAYLECACCGADHGWWNYTHNCNGMMNAALDPDYQQREVAEEVFRFKDKEHVSWWARLDGLPGPEGAALLDRIIRGMEADPHRYWAMNPENGWGDYHGVLKVLRSMLDAVPEYPTRWVVRG